MAESATATVESPTRTQTPAPQTLNREEQIRLRAYALFEERQGAPGDADNDWYRAEAELAEKPAEATK